MSYNPISHEILWDVGKIKAGTGYGNDSQEVAFQVGFIPGFTQTGKTPALISQTKFTGKDDFTGVVIDHTTNPLSTMLSTDPQFDAKQAMVTP